MRSDEQRGLARPDGRDAEGPEVIGDEPVADTAEHTQPLNSPVAAQHTQPMGSPVAAAPPDPWGQPAGDPWIDVTPGDPTTETVGAAPESRGRRIGGAVGLFAAGAVLGALVTGSFTGWGSNNASALTPQTGQSQGSAAQPGVQPPAQGQQPGAGQGGQAPNGQGGLNGQGRAGRDGEIRLVGTLTAVSRSKVTVQSAAGTATYTISSSTRILRDGAQAKASDLHEGDVALVHVFPSTSGDGVLELIYARSTASESGRSSDDGSTT